MSTSLSIMTYNVHSCIGSDGAASPERIAEVIALYGADIICLQELDVGLLRSGKEDQAREIADLLNMDFHFHPSFKLEEGEFGNAILSRHRSVMIRAAELPTLKDRSYLERRGALWARITVNKRDINVLTTHLGLSHRERLAQSRSLLGPEWLGSPACSPPVIICGDLNSVPLFGMVYRRFARSFVDACHCLPWGRGRTWPSRFPFMRLDHMFMTRDIGVDEVLIPKTRLTRIASDHLPVVAKLSMGNDPGREWV